MQYGKTKNIVDNKNINHIEQELKGIEEALTIQENPELRKRKTLLMHELETIYLNKAKAAQVRARAHWVEEERKIQNIFLV